MRLRPALLARRASDEISWGHDVFFRSVPAAHTLVRGVDGKRLRRHSADSTLPPLWPTGSSSGWLPSIPARSFSASPSDSTSRWTPCPPRFHRGQRGVTPAFGYGALHPSTSGTSTHLSTSLPSAHYGAVRLPVLVHHRRTSSTSRCGLGSCAKASTGPPGSQARCVRACSGSQTAQGSRPSRESDGPDVAFRSFSQRRHPGGEEAFAAQYPAHAFPCQRFAGVLAGAQRMTRGRCGSLCLHRSALSSVTSRRFRPAHEKRSKGRP